jgi:hypothetical protein
VDFGVTGMTDMTADITEIKHYSWIENFVGVLLNPITTFRQLADQNEHHLTGFGGATMAVLVPCALDGLRMTPPSNMAMAGLTIPASIIMGLLMWATLAGLLSLTGWVFGAPMKRCRRAFVLTGWSFAPWMFMGPVYCYREALGIWFAIFAIIPFAWMFILQMMAVREAFELKSTQMLLLFFAVPSLYFLLQMLQVTQGFYVSLTSVM